jgi:hypothetical protein
MGEGGERRRTDPRARWGWEGNVELTPATLLPSTVITTITDQLQLADAFSTSHDHTMAAMEDDFAALLAEGLGINEDPEASYELFLSDYLRYEALPLDKRDPPPNDLFLTAIRVKAIAQMVSSCIRRPPRMYLDS